MILLNRSILKRRFKGNLRIFILTPTNYENDIVLIWADDERSASSNDGRTACTGLNPSIVSIVELEFNKDKSNAMYFEPQIDADYIAKISKRDSEIIIEYDRQLYMLTKICLR